jgi:hypothetical protein
LLAAHGFRFFFAAQGFIFFFLAAQGFAAQGFVCASCRFAARRGAQGLAPASGAATASPADSRVAAMGRSFEFMAIPFQWDGTENSGSTGVIGLSSNRSQRSLTLKVPMTQSALARPDP